MAFDKMTRVAGRDANGKARALSVVRDDEGNYVLRVVDAAPYLVEYGRIDDVRHYNAYLSPINSMLVDINPKRKFLSVTNLSDEGVFLGLGKDAEPGKGLYLSARQTYEMNTMRGNLFCGKIMAVAGDNLVNMLETTSIVQGGLLPTYVTGNLTRTRTSPMISANPDTTYTILINGDVNVRNIVGYPGTDAAQGAFLLLDTLTKKHTFTTPSNINNFSVSFCKAVTTEELTPAETALSEIIIVEHIAKIVYTEGE